MRRGDVVLVVLPASLGKPRPAVIIQSNRFVDAHATLLVCPLTTDLLDLPLFRLRVVPTPANGLRRASEIMVDKIHAVNRTKIRGPVGQLDEATIASLNNSIALFTGLSD
jgi:mRNA interferase MazF